MQSLLKSVGLSMVCSGSGVGVSRADKPRVWGPTLVTVLGPAGSQCLSIWDKAGRQEDPASPTALSNCPLTMAPLCHTEQTAKQQLAPIIWCFSETRFAGADPANAADTGAGRCHFCPPRLAVRSVKAPIRGYVAYWM